VSDLNILIGYIEEAGIYYRPDDATFFRRANDAVIASLPQDDPWPPLCRAMFSVTGADELHGSAKGQRVIHFAGHFNAIGQDLPQWLDKFEALLRRLYWIQAEVLLMHTYTGVPLCLRYGVERATVEQYTGPSPRPPVTWELEGFDLEMKAASPEGFVAELVGGRASRG
jgi:hypothetical protein